MSLTPVLNCTFNIAYYKYARIRIQQFCQWGFDGGFKGYSAPTPPCTPTPES